MNSYTFGEASRRKLITCHDDLSRIAFESLRRSPYDITIVHGWRGEALQNKLFADGASKTPWPKSKHNNMKKDIIPDTYIPDSLAIDFAPYINGQIPWDDTHIFAHIAGVFASVANEMNIVLIWGGDWDSDGSTKDQTLLDWGHVHIVLKES